MHVWHHRQTSKNRTVSLIVPKTTWGVTFRHALLFLFIFAFFSLWKTGRTTNGQALPHIGFSGSAPACFCLLLVKLIPALVCQTQHQRFYADGPVVITNLLQNLAKPTFQQLRTISLVNSIIVLPDLSNLSSAFNSSIWTSVQTHLSTNKRNIGKMIPNVFWQVLTIDFNFANEHAILKIAIAVQYVWIRSLSALYQPKNQIPRASENHGHSACFCMAGHVATRRPAIRGSKVLHFSCKFPTFSCNRKICLLTFSTSWTAGSDKIWFNLLTPATCL